MDVSVERRRGLTLAATIIGSSLSFVDATVVVVALPTIERDLGLGLAGQQWVFLVYVLALAALYLPAGAVGDRFGRRATFVAGSAAFALASLVAGAAPGGATLIAARALQGVAGAFLTTNSLALLRATYGAEAGRAIGTWTAFTSVATVAGPPLGGALVMWASWRWIFLINLPLAAAAIVLARLGRCDERAQLRQGRLDLPGAALATVGFGALTYALVEGAERGLREVWPAIVVAAVGLAAFVEVERRSAAPMLPFSLFRRRNLAVSNLETFFVYAAIYGFLLYVTLYVQFIGFTPFEAGLINAPISVVLVLLAARFGAIADRHGPRLLLTLGPALIAAGTLMFVLVEDRSGFWVAGVPALLVFSVGLSMMVAPITATALKSAPSELAGIASAVNNAVSRIGSLISIALMGLVVSLVFDARVDAPDAVPLAKEQRAPEVRAASVDAFQAAMLVAAGLALAGAAVAAAGISNREARRDDAAIAAPAET